MIVLKVLLEFVGFAMLAAAVVLVAMDLVKRYHRPEAEVWILFGHGACGYSLAEFDTFVRHGIQIIAV